MLCAGCERWPCDTTAAKLELLTAKIAEYLHPNGLWSEPEGKEEGELERVFERSRAEGGGGAVRVLDLGEFGHSLNPSCVVFAADCDCC